MMETNALYELKPHLFTIHTFKGLKRCDFCRKNIWGFRKQGLKCEDCGFICHKKCIGRIPAGGCHPAEKYASRGAEKPSQKYGEKAANGEMKGNEKAQQTGPFIDFNDLLLETSPSGTFEEEDYDDELQIRHENGVKGQQEDSDEHDDGKVGSITSRCSGK